MVQVDPQLLIPLHMIIAIFFVTVFALLKEFKVENRNWFMGGMLAGAIIYAMLPLSSTIVDSKTGEEFILKYLGAGFAGTYYVVVLLFSGAISFLILAKKDSIIFKKMFRGKTVRLLYIVTGMALIFTITDVYFMLRCVETIPFFENFVKTNPLCTN